MSAVAPGPAEVFSTGDRLERHSEDSLPTLRLTAPFEKPGWNARLPGNQTHSPFPGTPIEFEGAFWEILRIDPATATAMVYTLGPWDDRELLRTPRRLDEASLQQIAAQHATDSKPRPPFFLLPLYGLLPAADQRRNELEMGLPAARATLVSALIVLVIAIPASAAALLLIFDPLGFGSQHPDLHWLKPTSPIWFHLFGESLIRLLVSLGLEAPMGSYPVVLASTILRVIGRRTHRRADATDGVQPPIDALNLFHARDRVTPLEATAESPISLEILSPLAKPDWVLGRTPILYQGTCYVPTERTVLGEGRQTRHRFLLEPLQSATLEETPVDYSVDDAGRRARNLVRQRRLDWFDLFGYFWGFLSAPLQNRLEVVFGYDPVAYTRLNATVTLALSLLGTTAALLHLIGGAGQLLDLLMLVSMAFLSVESGRRLIRVNAGVVTGSIVAHAVRPFAERLLKGLE